jgi:hypothetical protein
MLKVHQWGADSILMSWADVTRMAAALALPGGSSVQSREKCRYAGRPSRSMGMASRSSAPVTVLKVYCAVRSAR